MPNSPYTNHFTSPDTIIPEQSQGVQAWDRYAYTNNNPLRYSDPSGHCVFGGIDTLACIGFAVGAGVNLVSQYQKLQEGSIEKISWGEVAVAGTVGAVAAVTGAAIAVGAAAVGAATGSALAEVVVGTIGAGTANVVLNNTQRAATDLVNNEPVSMESVGNDFNENFASDMSYGMAGYGLGKTFSIIGEGFWSPHDVIERPPVFGEPLLSTPIGGVTGLLDTHPAQNIVTGSINVAAQSLSNSTLIEFWHRHHLEEE